MYDIKTFLLNALSADANTRHQSEQILRELQQKSEVVLNLPSFFSDADPRVRKLSSVFFKNAIKAEWTKGTFYLVKKSFLDNFLHVIAQTDKSTVIEIRQVLDFLLETEKPSDFETLTISAAQALRSTDERQYGAGLVFFSRAVRQSKIIYNDEAFSAMIEPAAVALIDLMCRMLNERRFLYVRMVVRLLCEVSDTHVRTFLGDMNFFRQLFAIFAEVLRLTCDGSLESDGYVDPATIVQTHIYVGLPFKHPEELLFALQAWVVEFFNRWYARAQKRSCRQKEVATFLHDGATFSVIHNTLVAGLRRDVPRLSDAQGVYAGSRHLDWLVRNSLSFFTHALDTRVLRGAVIADPVFFIAVAVLPLHVFSPRDDDLFDSDPAKFVRERYSYYATDARSYAAIFFADLVKRLRKQPAALQEIFQHFKGLLFEHLRSPSLATASRKHAVLYLVAAVAEHFSSLIPSFVTEHLLPELFSPYKFLRSQACYCLQYLDGKAISGQAASRAFDLVVANCKSEHEVVRTDALIAIPFFFDCPHVQEKLRMRIPEFVRMLVEIQKMNEIDAISECLEAIISNYPDVVQQTAPELISQLCAMILPNITSTEEDRISIHQGYLRTILSLIISIQSSSKESLPKTAINCHKEEMNSQSNVSGSDMYAKGSNIYGKGSNINNVSGSDIYNQSGSCINGKGNNGYINGNDSFSHGSNIHNGSNIHHNDSFSHGTDFVNNDVHSNASDIQQSRAFGSESQNDDDSEDSSPIPIDPRNIDLSNPNKPSFDSIQKQRLLIRSIYIYYLPVLQSIFQNHITDLYDEALQLIGETIFVLREIDESIVNLFYMMMSIPKDDKQLLACEIHFCLENFFSFAHKNDLIKPSRIAMTFIEQMCNPEDGLIEEGDDFSIGLLTMQCILTNLNSDASQAIPQFLNLSNAYYETFDRDSAVFLHFLTLIIFCFLINYEVTLNHLHSKGILFRLFEDLSDYRHLFTRAFDNSLMVLFCLFLFTNQLINLHSIKNIHTQQDIHFIDFYNQICNNSTKKDLNLILCDKETVKRLSLIFYTSIDSLPKAIYRRKCLFANKDIDDYEDYVVDEEIYEETPLDHFNFNEVLKNSLNNFNDLGFAALSLLDSAQHDKIRSFIQ